MSGMKDNRAVAQRIIHNSARVLGKEEIGRIFDRTCDLITQSAKTGQNPAGAIRLNQMIGEIHDQHTAYEKASAPQPCPGRHPKSHTPQQG